jgi:hypothetical protein
VSNPVTSWPFLVIDPQRDGPRFDQNFEALIDWARTDAVHTHHLQYITFDIPAVTAGSNSNVTGLTYPQAYPAGIQPYVMVIANSAGSATAGVARLNFYPINVSNTGCDVVCFNGTATGSTAATGEGKLIAFDPTFNTVDA